jgi:hypothetical protein
VWLAWTRSPTSGASPHVDPGSGFCDKCSVGRECNRAPGSLSLRQLIMVCMAQRSSPQLDRFRAARRARGLDPATDVDPRVVLDPYCFEPRRIQSRHLRAVLTLAIHGAGREVTVAELVGVVTAQGFVLRGRPGKTVSDALRAPVAREWVRRVGRGRYAPGRMAKVTAHRQRARATEARRRLAEQLGSQ